MPRSIACDFAFDGTPVEPELAGKRTDRPSSLVQDFEFHVNSFRLHVSLLSGCWALDTFSVAEEVSC